MNHCKENALVTLSNDPIAAHDEGLIVRSLCFISMADQNYVFLT